MDRERRADLFSKTTKFKVWMTGEPRSCWLDWMEGKWLFFLFLSVLLDFTSSL